MLFELILRIASAEASKSDRLRLGETEIVHRGIGPVMQGSLSAVSL